MTVERYESTTTSVGGLPVRRALPKRDRRTVGPWCFVDHFGPVSEAQSNQMQVGPHPHIGLQTVTWLIEGEVLHTDSVGSEQMIRPGQLNLMTAGRGISHAESAQYSADGSHGVQFWVAQPESTRHGDPAFEHHSELPVVEYGDTLAHVLVGSFAGETSPARTDWPMVGVELVVNAGTFEVPLNPEFEHGLIATAGGITVEEIDVTPGLMTYFPEGRSSLRFVAHQPGRVLFFGGQPFESKIKMWWNFVARTSEEIEEAQQQWNSGSDRFGEVHSDIPLIAAPPVPWL